MHQKEFFGYGSIKNLAKILSDSKPKKIFLVTGKNSFESSGAKENIEPLVEHYCYIRFSDFSENPKIEDIQRGIAIFKEENCDFVIAVGGGSVIDIAKSINALASNSSGIDTYLSGNQVLKKGKTLVAIPTTSGTGSESTKFAVLYAGKVKKSLEGDSILPDFSIVDPELTMNLPWKVAASCSMDALSQAIESYWSVNSTDESKKYSKKSIELCMKYLVKSVNSQDKASKEAMAMASNLAGKAINIAKTTAPHAISYPMTSYFRVPHGHAVALTIPGMLLYNYQVRDDDVLDKRGAAYVRNTILEISRLIGSENVGTAAKITQELMTDIGLSIKLSDLGIDSIQKTEIIIKNGFDPNRVKNNPRRLTEDNLRVMLKSIA